MIRRTGVILLSLGICTALLYFYRDSWPLSGIINEFYANVSAELVGIAITVLVIDHLYERRQKQQLKLQLIREMSSLDNGIALRAVEELRAHEWLVDGSLVEASLRKANLAEANLRDAVLNKSDMSNANLRNASLRNASLENTNLSGSNLKGAFLRGAILYQATLAGADLCNAVLLKSDLEETNLAGAHYNKLTQWPDGYQVADTGAILDKD